LIEIVAGGLHKREIAGAGNSAEVLHQQSVESLPVESTEELNRVELKRELGLFSSVSVNVGSMIGKQRHWQVSSATDR
jgi:hypothetical protein